jgi:hypothetical protein
MWTFTQSNVLVELEGSGMKTTFFTYERQLCHQHVPLTLVVVSFMWAAALWNVSADLTMKACKPGRALVMSGVSCYLTMASVLTGGIEVCWGMIRLYWISDLWARGGEGVRAIWPLENNTGCYSHAEHWEGMQEIIEWQSLWMCLYRVWLCIGTGS